MMSNGSMPHSIWDYNIKVIVCDLIDFQKKVINMDFKKNVRAILAKKNISISGKLNYIKQNISPGDYKDALKMHPSLIIQLASRQPFRSEHQISLREPFGFTGDFKREFKWAAGIIELNFEIIDKFLSKKNAFDSAFVVSEFDKAKDILLSIEDEFGIGLWTIQANLMLIEFTDGTEKNWEKLSFYLDRINNPFYEFVISAFSKRIERSLPYDGYQNQFQNDLDNADVPEFIRDFLVFKCFSIANYSYEFVNLESVLYLSNIFNPIDQYLIFVDAIIYVLSITNEFDKYVFPFIKKSKDILLNDFRLPNIYNIINSSGEILESSQHATLIACLNAYYSGRFDDACLLAETAIRSNPLEFEFYEVYCKSLINLKKPYIPINISDITEKILVSVYNTLSFEKLPQDSRRDLLKSSLLLMDISLGKQAYALLSEIEVLNDRAFMTAIIYSFVNSPKILLAKNRDNLIRNNFSKAIHEHFCFKVFAYKAGDNVLHDEQISKSNAQSASLAAIHLFNSGDYNGVIDLLSKSDCLNDNKYYYERKVSLMLTSLLRVGNYKRALKLFGEIFFSEDFVTGKLDYEGLFAQIKSSGFENYTESIDLPVLYSLIKKEYDLYEVVDEFLSTQDILFISDIDVNAFSKKFTLSKTVYFLSKVLTINTLKYSTDYGSISMVEEERVKILNILLNIDNENKIEYEKEINDIYRINSVRKVIKEVDEGRLFIDVKNLKDLQVKSFNDVFNRFRDIALSSNSKNLIGFNSANVRNWEIDKQDKSEVKEEYNSADYLAFKNMYLVSRDNFLFSKEYGLDSCLSTRIRHGALKNHIRSVFEKLDLVTSKYNEKYVDNKVWESQLRLNPGLNNIVQEKLKLFSREIDDYTGYIVNNLIQIKTEKFNEKPDGLFAYFTNDEILSDFYEKNNYLFTSIESTIERLLATLVSHTLTDLGRTILEAFTKNIPLQFKEIIGRYISELRDLEGINSCDIIPNLTKSSTDIQIELEYLSSWFYLNTTSSASLLPLGIILDASIELTNKINPTFNLQPQINIETEVLGYSNLIFVLNIMLNNVIYHSKLSSDKLELRIDVALYVDKKHVFVKFTHKLNTDFDYSANKIKLESIKHNWNDHSNIDRSNKEGESGYDKIKRILLYEALAKTSLFDFMLSEDIISISLFLPYNERKNIEERPNY